MKKILVLVAFLLVASACAKQSSTSTATNSNANTAPTKSAPPSEADIIAKEKSVWDTLKLKDYDAFGNMLATDYVEVTDEGVLDKAGIIAVVKDFIPTDITYSDWKMLPIDNDAVILTYNVTVKATVKGQDVPAVPQRAAAVWINRDGKWLACYFQQTPVKALAKEAAPAATKSTSPSPATKLADTGSDPIANEKIVWDAFKTKNSDGFAALLDPAFVEIESTAVYDKAGAIKGTSEMDASQFELSEWKAAKLDNETALVTYLVKPRDPKWDTERHTSIWANRGGKWVVLLHVGTPVAKPAAKSDAK